MYWGSSSLFSPADLKSHEKYLSGFVIAIAGILQQTE